VIEKTIKSADPKTFAQALVACLGADKGVPAIFIEVVGDVPGTWAVLTEAITLTIEPNESTQPA
jgi:hypothetical protein